MELIVVSVLFVCLGNICRSPTAEAVFRSLVNQEGLSDQVHVDSAGTSSWHIGGAPDRRSTAAARKRGIDLSLQKARQIKMTDFDVFDLILAMDQDNFNTISNLAPAQNKEKLKLLLDFSPKLGRKNIPDPYYGGENGFDLVLDLVEYASSGLLKYILKNHL